MRIPRKFMRNVTSSYFSYTSYSYLPHFMRISVKFTWNFTSPFSNTSYTYLPHFMRIPEKFTWNVTSPPIHHIFSYLTLWEFQKNSRKMLFLLLSMYYILTYLTYLLYVVFLFASLCENSQKIHVKCYCLLLYV